MPIKKYIAASMALTLSLMHTVPAYADSSDSIENIMNIQMSSVEQTISNVSDLVLNTMDSVSVEHTESIEIDSDSYLLSEPVYVYTEQAEAEPVMTTIEVPDEWICGNQEDNTEMVSEVNQDYINEAQTNYEAALEDYEQALAEYEAASQMFETTKEAEVEIVEEVTDEDGNVSEVIRTEIQTVTDVVHVGDVDSAKANLYAASAALEPARQALETTQFQTTIIEQPQIEDVSLYQTTIAESESEQQAIIEDDVVVTEEVTQATSGTCGDNLTWTLDDNGLLTISGTGDMNDFNYGYGGPWGTEIKSLIIESGVTSIGDRAFEDCTSLTSITIPDGVTRIGDYAFSGCTNLTSIEIPNSVTDITSYAFRRCSNLVYIKIPDSVTNMDEGVFYNCVKLTGITLPQTGKLLIVNSMFYGCTSLKSIRIPEGETLIGQHAFHGCTSLTDVTIPNSLIRIREYAFFNCSSLTNITIPNSVTEIWSSAFRGCTSLTSATLSTSLTSIESYAFYYCSSLTSIIIPDSVTSIGSDAFSNCVRLSNVTISTSITSIGDEVFKSTGLASIIIPENVTSIGTGAFRYCSHLTSVTIPNRVTSIGYGAFENCSSLSSVTIPTSVTSIGKNAFYNIGSSNDFSDVYYSGTEDEWKNIDVKENAFSNKTVIHYLGRYDNYIYISNGYVLMQDVFSHFQQSAYQYDHDIAKYAAGLSTLVYSDDMKLIDTGLKTIGYSCLESNYSSTTNNENYQGNYSPVIFGLHYIPDLNSTVVIAVIRGTYHEEWMTNFDIGDGDNHEGFEIAANHVYSHLDSYITNHSNQIKGTLKILVTGHSRGAATANLVAAYLDNPSLFYIDRIVNVDAENVYAYTFATPNTTSIPMRNDVQFDNIFNIVNPEDFVTKVVPSAWGYGRFGKTFVLPSSTSMTKSKYSTYLKTVRSYYEMYDKGEKYDPYPNGMYDVSKYVRDVTSEVANVFNYYNKDLGYYGPLKDLYRYGLGGLLSDNHIYASCGLTELVSAVLCGYGTVGLKTVRFFIKEEVVGKIYQEAFVGHNVSLEAILGNNAEGILDIFKTYFSDAHLPETYLAMVNAISGESEYGGLCLYNIVNCPVDIRVYNSAGTLVGQIINNEVQTGNEIWMYVDGDSKIYCLPDDDTYRVELSGNDTGVMDYSSILEDMDTYEQQKAYHEGLELTAEKIYTTDDTSVYTVLTTDETQIEPSAEFDSETGKLLKVDITIEGRGSASSLENLTPGDYVTLKADKDRNNFFYGWYDSNGELVSTEDEYSFSIHSDMEFTAKFSDYYVGTESMTFEKESVILNKSEQYYNNLTIGPANATVQKIIWTSSDENIVTVDNGVILTINAGTAVITATLEDGTSAEYTVTVKEDPVIESKHTLSLDGNIAVNFYFSLADYVKNDSGTKVEFTVDGNTISQSIGQSVEYLQFNRFSVDVSYKQMTTDIHADVILSTGEVVYSEEYRAKDYCDEKLAGNTINEKLRNLLETLLNYGGYAQLQFDYNTDNLANADLEDTDVTDVTIEQMAPYKAVTSGSEEGITQAGSTLTLNSLTSIKHYFTIAEGHNISEYTFKLNDQVLTPVMSGQMYYVEIPNIASKELDAMYTVTVGDYSITYGALSYAYDHVNRPNESETLKDVCRALYKYNQAADAYFGG